MGGWQRWGIVLVVAAVALPAATVLGKGGESGPIPEKQTTCWPCHVGWSDPLKTFFVIVPPASAGGPVGEQFNYVVQLQNPWLQQITYIAPTLVIGSAPSLQFAGGPAPIQGLALQGAVTLKPSSPGAPIGDGFVPVAIPVGMTYVDVKLAPIDQGPTGPTLHLKLYTGTTKPQGTPQYDEKAKGAGAAIEHAFDGTQALSKVGGTGNWTIQAVVDDVAGLGLPKTNGQVPFVVTINARAEAGGSSLVQAQTVDIQKHATFLFTYGLKASKQPGPGEVVGLVVNATMHYNHKAGSTDNFANVTKAFDQPLNVQTDGANVVIRGPQPPGRSAGPKNGASLDTISEAVGYATAFLLISSIWTGGLFGKASRRQLNGVFGSAKRRVAFHNFLSYGILLTASIHTVLFLVETAYYWTLGLIWGGLAILSMFGLGLTGAFQVGMIRRWNYATWRWSHYALSWAAIVFTILHMGLDGVHFGFIQERLHWTDPLDPRHVK